MIPKDKLKHFIVGALIASLTYYYTGSQTLMWVITLVFAIGKELIDLLDSKRSSHPEVWDSIATCIPAMIITLLIWQFPNLQH